MREQLFGIEIELTGLSRHEASKVIADYFHTREIHSGGAYDIYKIGDSENRKWKVVSDSSIFEESKKGIADSTYKVEIVSPVCRYSDIETIQEIVRLLRHHNAIANESCGIHIHVNASLHTAQSIRNLVNIIYSKENLIYKALAVRSNRENSYCRRIDERFVQQLNREKPNKIDDIKKLWYNGTDGSYQHYHSSRYHLLNLHSVFRNGTVEFRAFNSTTHAGKIKAYIQFCLAINHQAMIQKSASYQRTNTTNDKYTFRVWLLRLGLIGSEFKTARKHLLSNLDGNGAWRTQEQADIQKERIREERIRQIEQLQQERREINENETQYEGFSMT